MEEKMLYFRQNGLNVLERADEERIIVIDVIFKEGKIR
jgi:hypothetical protein